MLGPGRDAKRPRISEIGELGEGEVGNLVHGSDPVIKRLRDSHHRIARLFAAGLKGIEVAELTGYSEVHISRLRNTPIMQDLIAGYSSVVDEAWKTEISDYYRNMSE